MLTEALQYKQGKINPTSALCLHPGGERPATRYCKNYLFVCNISGSTKIDGIDGLRAFLLSSSVLVGLPLLMGGCEYEHNPKNVMTIWMGKCMALGFGVDVGLNL